MAFSEIELVAVFMMPVLYLGTFIARNLLVGKRIRQSVRARSPLLTLSIILSTLSFITLIVSALSAQCYARMGAMTFLHRPLVAGAGLALFTASVISGWFVSAQLKDSWRVGVSAGQETELIREGMYAYIRNPYFLSLYFMYSGMLLMRPSLVLLSMVLATAGVFHLMVLKEEAFLLEQHGDEYRIYRDMTGRYLPRLGRRLK